jgi:hypothetical protein
VDVPDLFHGGLLYRVVRRFGVEPEHAARAARRAALAAFVLWTPMLVGSLLEGRALPGDVAVPFLLDVAAYVRPLVVVPLLLVSEVVLARAWRLVGTRLRDRGIVGPECQSAADALVDRVTRAGRATLPEIVCAAISALLVGKLVQVVVSAPRDTWFAAAAGDGGSRLTFAGVWAALAVHGLMIYLSLRWLWLFFLWYRFLLGLARLPIRLLPAHPDRAAGLGFVGEAIAAASPVVFAWSAALACAVANRLIHHGASISEFVPVGIAVLVFVLLVFVAPPALVFLPLLVRTRREALERWSLRLTDIAAGRAPAADGAGEVSREVNNLQDLAVAVDAVRAMRPVPVWIPHVVAPLLAAAVPAVPVLFVAFPASQVFEELARLLL